MSQRKLFSPLTMRGEKPTEIMINSIETYTDAGAKAGRAAKHKDMPTVAHHGEWLRRAKRLETPEDARAAQQAYDEAYRENSGFYDKPKYFN